LELALDLDKRSVGGVETSRKDRGDVEGDGWIASKDRRRVGDIEFRIARARFIAPKRSMSNSKNSKTKSENKRGDGHTAL